MIARTYTVEPQSNKAPSEKGTLLQVPKFYYPYNIIL